MSDSIEYHKAVSSEKRERRKIVSKLLSSNNLYITMQSQGHWFEPSQAHCIFEFRVSIWRVAVVLIRIPSAALPARKALLKTGSKRTEQGPSPEIARARETPKRMPGFECVPVAKPGDQ